MATINARMRQRRRTAAQWTTEDPVLDPAEFGVESDTGRFKVGDGTAAWTALAYADEIVPVGSLSATTPQEAFEQLSGVRQYDIRAFGATGSSARAGIQAALDEAALAAALGLTAVVWVPPGTWQLDDEVVVPNGTTLRGAPGRSVLRMDDGDDDDNAAMVRLGFGTINDNTVENITVEDLTLDGNRQNMVVGSERDGVLATSNKLNRNIRLANLVIKNQGHYAIGIQGNGAQCENIRIENVYAENLGADAIDIKGYMSRGCSITNLTVEGHGQDRPAQGAIDLRMTWAVSNVDIRSLANNKFTDHVGVRFHGDNGLRSTPAIGCVVTGVTVAPTGGDIDNAVISTAAASGVTGQANVQTGLAYRRAIGDLVTEGSSGDDQTVYTTASITPPANRLLLLAVYTSGTGAADPTVTGGGLTWTLVNSASTGASNRIALYRAMAWLDDPPTTGPLTLTYGAVCTNVLWRLEAIDSVSLISDADAIVQSAVASNATATALNTTLAAFNHANNGTWSVWGQVNSVIPPTPEAGSLVKAGADGGLNRLISTTWRPDNDTTPGVTYAAATNVAGISVELRVCRP